MEPKLLPEYKNRAQALAVQKKRCRGDSREMYIMLRRRDAEGIAGECISEVQRG